MIKKLLNLAAVQHTDTDKNRRGVCLREIAENEDKHECVLSFFDLGYLKSALKEYSKNGMPDGWQPKIARKIYQLAKKFNDTEKAKIKIGYKIPDPEWESEKN